MNFAQTTALGLIDLYQRNISPRKGFVCAHNALFRAGGCSGYAKDEIARKGVMRGLQSLAQRFRECAVAAKVVQTLRGARRRNKNATRSIAAVAAFSFTAMSAANADPSPQHAVNSTPEYSDCTPAQDCADSCSSPKQPRTNGDAIAKHCAAECVGNVVIGACGMFF